jgi:hypothetical protein
MQYERRRPRARPHSPARATTTTVRSWLDKWEVQKDLWHEELARSRESTNARGQIPPRSDQGS